MAGCERIFADGLKLNRIKTNCGHAEVVAGFRQLPRVAPLQLLKCSGANHPFAVGNQRIGLEPAIVSGDQ